MKAGLGKVDITPRVGVELCGFGPFNNRRSVGVRDRLWARALAVEAGGTTVVLVSCDLIGLGLNTSDRVREQVGRTTGLPERAVMVHCTHTHSGPSTAAGLTGWGAGDAPYLEVLPYRVARACEQAVANLSEARLSHAAVPCEGVGLNREYDKDAPPLDEVLRDDWRPAMPERTDTVCHVLKLESADRLIGFASYFGCHPVTCCAETRLIHGDFAGVATNVLEREHPGSTGLFLQGAQGDVNSCVVHKPEQEALLALDVIASRYAHAVRAGLARAEPVEVDAVRCVLKPFRPTRMAAGVDDLRAWLAEHEAVFAAPEAADADRGVRMAAVYAQALRQLIGKAEAGRSLAEPTVLQGFRLGPIALLGTPFEMFQAVKNDIVAEAQAPVPLVLGLTNDLLGYAPDRQTAERGGYAAKQVPFMLGSLPFADIHMELVRAALDLDADLAGDGVATSDSGAGT